MGNSESRNNNLDAFESITADNKNNKSVIVSYAKSVDGIVRNEISEKFHKETKHTMNPIEFNSFQYNTSTDLLKMNLSIAALAKRYCNIAKGVVQSPICDKYTEVEEDASAVNFNYISNFLEYAYYRSINNSINDRIKNKKNVKLIEIDSEIIDALIMMKYEIESLKESSTTQKEKNDLEKLHKILDCFNNNENTDWKNISESLLGFINEQVKNFDHLTEKSFEAFMSALSLYVFSSLREGVFSNEDLDQITKVINGVCKNLQKCFTTLHLDNSEASFKRDQAPYFGIDRLPGVGPVDIFAALIQGLKSVVIQKLKCEETNSVMSIDATTSSSGNAGENHCILKGCNQLKLTKPASFQHFDKENNVRFEIEVKIPIIYQLDSSDPHRAWDYLSEIWEFKPLEHTIYFSPLVYRIVTELSAIYSVLENVHQEIAKETSTQVSSSTQTNEGAIITTVTTVTTKIMIPKQFLYSDYARFKKTFRRRLYYVAHVDRIKDIILEVQEPWVQVV
ncbi:12119_t:CDS:1 [Entrophospora sp. SA101]|nr:1319_t:CDS:1 [Entrophospora sp. SA101]CAJ0748231.1 15761_t:CDS:1 [Entrophospora sp. SA101]CAJ0761861.1 12119_t:CDS:1 [Entrophospora sp. SA101]CAJ0902960.1 1060_t:CDS:1 [Entrophospora sp. SA101]CAJ0911251.1 20480_t:CDS:1 [Entrophospora sp. SA101]